MVFPSNGFSVLLGKLVISNLFYILHAFSAFVNPFLAKSAGSHPHEKPYKTLLS